MLDSSNTMKIFLPLKCCFKRSISAWAKVSTCARQADSEGNDCPKSVNRPLICAFCNLYNGISAARKASTTFVLKSFFETCKKSLQGFLVWRVVEKVLMFCAVPMLLNAEALVTIHDGIAQKFIVGIDTKFIFKLSLIATCFHTIFHSLLWHIQVILSTKQSGKKRRMWKVNCVARTLIHWRYSAVAIGFWWPRSRRAVEHIQIQMILYRPRWMERRRERGKWIVLRAHLNLWLLTAMKQMRRLIKSQWSGKRRQQLWTCKNNDSWRNQSWVKDIYQPF